jgi:exodeoxyribonuclease V alpha subunit
VPCRDAEDGAAKIIEIVKDRIPARFRLDPIRDIQVLCPMNRGGLGARALNLELQRILNPPGDDAIQRFGWTFGPGDKVMQVENDYDKEVYNGDLGFVRSIEAEAGDVLVEFDGRKVAYGFDELDELVVAYATTIHKAQGSEYPAVVIPLTTQHYPMLRRNLFYTGVTRGRRLVVIVGQRRAIGIAIRGRQSLRRWSKLKEWLETQGRGKDNVGFAIYRSRNGRCHEVDFRDAAIELESGSGEPSLPTMASVATSTRGPTQGNDRGRRQSRPAPAVTDPTTILASGC